MSQNTAVHFLVNGGYFFYTFSMKKRKEVFFLDSYDNDALVLLLDDDLFPAEPEEPMESERSRVD